MSFNINTSAVIIESNITAAAQSCVPASTGTNSDDLFKLASASVVLFCAILTSGFVGVFRAIKAMHADIVKLPRADTLCDHKPTAPSSGTCPIAPTTEPETLGGRLIVSSESPQAEMSSLGGNGRAPERAVWGRVWDFAIVCLEQCTTAAATTVAASGMLLGTTLDVGEEELPSPVLMTPSRS